jgi:lysophospholipase L1-like esterase
MTWWKRYTVPLYAAPVVVPSQQCIEALQSERDALAKDAARYRWLRDGPSPAVDDVLRNTDPLRWDAAIDAAIFVGLWPENDKANMPRAFIEIGLRWLHAFREQAARAAPEQLRPYPAEWPEKFAAEAWSPTRAAPAQPADAMTADEATENAALVILRTVLQDDADAFLTWYKPSQWLGIHRAVAGYLAQKFSERAPAQPAEPD